MKTTKRKIEKKKATKKLKAPQPERAPKASARPRVEEPVAAVTPPPVVVSTVPDAVAALSRDLRKAAATLSVAEARYLVDTYYQMQEQRIRAAHQGRAMEESGEPHAVLTWLGQQTATLEAQIRSALGKFAEAHAVGRWALAQKGIGPVIAAGLLAHIDLEPWRCFRADQREKPCREGSPCTPTCRRVRTETVGKIWRFAGLDPTVTWGKGERRPWNARLKLLCWKIGDSFTKQAGREDAFYGQLYVQRRDIERQKNAAGAFAEQAARQLATRKYGKSTEAYKALSAGRLPDAQIILRSQRWATKLFLSHYHHVAYVDRFGTQPPKPFVIEHLGHVDLIPPPPGE